MHDVATLPALNRGNLPAATTSFVGRDQDLADVRRLLGETRLLTLTGAGGIGKTRLALEVAATEMDAFPDGVWLVELAPLAEPALIAPAVAQSLGVRETMGQPLLSTLLTSLRTSHRLLLLDNCEHLLDECATLADAILRSCPRVTILAMSREALGITAEVNWRTPSLSVPSPDEPPHVDRVASYAAVRLFIDRAHATQPLFTLTPQNTAAVAQICRSLDGVPLALELAAARVAALTVEEIAVRLDDRFRLLTEGSRAAPPRQRTLRATLDWSHELLTERERIVFRRLPVFAGGWTLAAAEAVCAGDEVAADDVLDLLTDLVAKSLVLAAEGPPGVTRYRLLETMREYALEQLTESGEAEAVRARHAAFFQALAESLAFVGPPGSEWNPEAQDVAWFDRIRADYENMRATMRRLTERNEFADGLRLGILLRLFWTNNGLSMEGQSYLSELLHRAEGRDDLVLERAWGTRVAGQLARGRGAVTEARALCEISLSLFRRLGQRYGIGHTLMNLGTLAHLRGDYAEARRQYAEALSVLEEIGDEHGVGYVLMWMGDSARDEGDFAAAGPLFEAARRQWHDLADLHCQTHVTIGLGALRYLEGDYAQARPLLDEGLDGQAKIGSTAVATVWSGLLDTAQGRYDAARVRLRSSLHGLIQTGNIAGACAALEGLAQVAAIDGEPAQALRLAGAAASRRQQIQVALAPSLRRIFDVDLQRAQRALGDDQAAAVWAAGQALTLEQAVAEATDAGQRHAGDNADGPAPIAVNGLTRREVEVLQLVANGQSNKEIGAALALSVHTVERHVATIYRKIDARNRADATSYAIHHGLA